MLRGEQRSRNRLGKKEQPRKALPGQFRELISADSRCLFLNYYALRGTDILSQRRLNYQCPLLVFERRLFAGFSSNREICKRGRKVSLFLSHGRIVILARHLLSHAVGHLDAVDL